MHARPKPDRGRLRRRSAVQSGVHCEAGAIIRKCAPAIDGLREKVA
jgi:hypothetical protein